MSEFEYVEPTSDSFWEIGQYKRTVRRCEDGYRLCGELVQMISERADIEKAYAKNLKLWSRKWNDYLQKAPEYGTMRYAYESALSEADQLADLHLTTHNALCDEINREIKDWQKQNYPKTIVNQLKPPKELEEEFRKAQKPWSKRYSHVSKCKKEYHSASRSFQSAKINLANYQHDPTLSNEQKKRLEEKIEKYKREVELTRYKYKHALEELNQYNSRYIEDMKIVYAKCDLFEKERLDFLLLQFVKLQSNLNLYEKSNAKEIYEQYLRALKQTDPEKDLQWWAKEYGYGMPMNWPVYEEYSEEFKTIARGARASRLVKDVNHHQENNGGIKVTAIKPKSESVNELSNRQASILNHTTSNSDVNKSASVHQAAVNKSKESNGSNPFGDEEDEAEDEPVKDTQKSNSDAVDEKMEANDRPSDESEADSESESSRSKRSSENYLNIRVRVLYDYKTNEDDELNLKEGEEFLKLSEEDDRGWCLGKIGDKIGHYPATYAEEIKEVSE